MDINSGDEKTADSFQSTMINGIFVSNKRVFRAKKNVKLRNENECLS